MSDNVYTVNPGLNGLIPKPDKDTPEEKESQIESTRGSSPHPMNLDMEPLVVADAPPMTLGEAYRLGASVERENLSESYYEYIESEVYGGCKMSEQHQEVLQAFVDWHLDQ